MPKKVNSNNEGSPGTGNPFKTKQENCELSYFWRMPDRGVSRKNIGR
jgi:hypothetical protein